MICDEVAALLRKPSLLREEGSACIVPTDCYYPSSELVCAHVTKIGDSYRVTDGGDLARVVFLHGRGNAALAGGLELASTRFELLVDGDTLVAEAPDAAWLPSAIRAIANGAALAAYEALGVASAARDKSLVDAIVEAVSRVVAYDKISTGYKAIGASGKEWTLDLAITGLSRPILINAVKPHPNSISANYTAFSDIGDANVVRWAVCREPLKAADAILMSRVAKVMPLLTVEDGTRSLLSVH